MKVIITLGGPLQLQTATPGHHLEQRLKETVLQYKKNDIVIVTGAKCQRLHISEAQVMSNWLEKYNIHSIVEERALNTIQNAIYTFEIIKNLIVKNVINENTQIMIITSSFHMPRASYLFIHYFNGFSLTFQTASTTQYDEIVKKEQTTFINILQNSFSLPEYKTPTLIDEIKAGHMKGVVDFFSQRTIEDLTEEEKFAIHWAVVFGFNDITTFLINQGIDINIQRNTLTPLHNAVLFGNIEAVWLLLNHQNINKSIKAKHARWPNMLTAKESLYAIRSQLSVVTYTVLLLIFEKFEKNNGIVWIRHAESEQNLFDQNKNNNRFEYNMMNKFHDTKLTANGYAILDQIRFWISKYDLLKDYDIYCSPLTRTLETCRKLIGEDCQKVVIVDQRIRERLNHISCIGKPKSELQKIYTKWNFDKINEKWWYFPEINSAHSRIISKESSENVQQRLNSFIDDIKDRKKKILVVTHGGIIHLLSQKLIKARNCEIFEYSFSEKN